MSIIGEIWEERYDKLENEKKLLEAKILDFRMKLKGRSRKLDATAITYERIVKSYDEHFDIKIDKQGKI